MHSLLEVLKLSADYLSRNGISHARRQVEELLCDALEMDRMHLYLQFDRPLQETELEKIRSWLKRRAKGEPLAYISGMVHFYGCKLHITRDVMIPRQETEILIDRISKELHEVSLEGKVLWDLCCGSGYIGIALKKAHPQLQIVLSDISEAALAVAKRNAEENHVSVELLQGDLLKPFEGRKADFFVCNPPYVSEAELRLLDKEVREYEPHLALVGGKNGMEFYIRLAAELPYYLNSGAKVWFEIGAEQGEAVLSLFQAPYWKNGSVKKDWAGKDRFFSLEFISHEKFA